jgi:hypothetical protein
MFKRGEEKMEKEENEKEKEERKEKVVYEKGEGEMKRWKKRK